MQKVILIFLLVFTLIACTSEPRLTQEEERKEQIQAEKELFEKKSQMIFDAKKGVLDTIKTYSEVTFDSLEGAELLSARIYLFKTTAEDEEVAFVAKMERLKVKNEVIQAFLDSLKQKDTLLKAMELEFIKQNKLDTTLYPYEN